MAITERKIDAALRGVDYGTAASLTATPGAYVSLWAGEIEEDADHEMLEQTVQKSQQARGQPASILGPQMGTVTFKTPWRGGKDSAGAVGESPIVTLGQYCGMEVNQIAGGAAAVTGGSSSTLTCLDAADPGWEVGDFVLVNADVGGTPDLQLRYITRIQSAAGTTTITVAPNFDTNPVSGDSFYALDILKPSPGAVSTFIGLDVYRGQGTTDRSKLRALGCAGTFKLETVASGELPWATFEYQIDNWVRSESNRAEALDGFADASPFMSDSMYVNSEAINNSSFSFDPGSKLVAQKSQTGANGRAGWRYLEPEPVLEFAPYFAQDYFDKWTGETSVPVFQQSVTDIKQCWGVYIPAVQFLKVIPSEISDGMAGVELTNKIIEPGQNADSVDYPLFSLVFSGETT